MLPFILIGVGVASMVLILALALTRQTATVEGTIDQVDARHVRQPGIQKAVPSSDEKSREQLRERLVHAGLYRQNSPAFFYLIQMTFVTIPLVIGLIGYRTGLVDFQISILMGLIFGVGGVIAPGFWLDFRKSKRQSNVRRAIPDALDVITICVEAGLSLSASIVRVSKDLAATHPLLATELTIVYRHIQMGKTAGEALRSFAERFDLAELRSLASVVAQSEKFGASIASALRVHGNTLRTKRMQHAQEKAQKAAIWILLPTVLCIFPALFVVILGPAAYDIMELMRTTGK